jgi:hypothetical protein
MDETRAKRLSNDCPAEQTRELRVGQFPDGARRTLLSAHLYRFSVLQSRQWRGQPLQVTYAAKTNARDGPIRYRWSERSEGQVTALGLHLDSTSSQEAIRRTERPAVFRAPSQGFGMFLTASKAGRGEWSGLSIENQ